MAAQWKPIVHPKYHFPTYEVSDMGEIRHAGTRNVKQPHINVRTGRKFINLYTPDKIREIPIYISVLVAYAYLGPRPNGYQVDHIDGDKLNDRLDNLEYVTQSENIQRDLRRNPRRKYHSHVRLTANEYDVIMRMGKAGHSQIKIAKHIGCSNSAVSRILNGICRHPHRRPMYLSKHK